MVDGLKSLPSAEEISRVFTDYKAMLKIARYRTPLQRIHRLTTQHCAIKYTQKLQTEADRVFNLLPPGLSTVHNVDLFRLILAGEHTVTLPIPVTLLDCGGKYALLRNSDTGMVVVRIFKENDKAINALQEEITRLSFIRPCYVHKSSAHPSSLHSSLPSALALWDNTSSPQHLQQFIPPVSKTPCVLRVHWNRSRSKPLFYLMTRGSLGLSNGLPSITTTGQYLRRAFSSPINSDFVLLGQDMKGLQVEKMRKGPELRNELNTCVKLLSSSLHPGTCLSEMVCDFAPTAGRKWVFLRCKGYSVDTKLKATTSVFEQHQVINLRFLMYPVVANRIKVRDRIKWSNKLQTITKQQPQEAISMMTSNEECFLGTESSEMSMLEQRSEDRDSPTARRKVAVKQLLTKGVGDYDRLIQGSRQFKEELKGKINLVTKYGTEDLWKHHIGEFFHHFLECKDIASFFIENIGTEESSMIACSMLRVIRGDFNFYYKETLKKIHHRMKISGKIYTEFLMELHKHLSTVIDDEEDANLAVKRFKLLQEYICSPEEIQKKGKK